MQGFQRLEHLLKAVKNRPINHERDLLLECTAVAKSLAAEPGYSSRDACLFRERHNFTQELIDYETQLENDQYQSELFSQNNIENWIQDYNHFERFNSLVDQTITLINQIDKRNRIRIIFIGTGAFPLTTIALAKAFPSVSILSIEKYFSVAQNAKHVISKFKSITNTTVICSDILHYCNKFQKNDIVVCSFIVGQQLQVDGTLEQLHHAVLKKQGTIIFRGASHAVESLYHPITFDRTYELEIPALDHEFQEHKAYGNSASKKLRKYEPVL